MRPLALYLRSRAVPATAGAVLVCAIGLWSLGLAIDHPQGRGLAALLVALAATSALGPGLAGADHDLERLGLAARRFQRGSAAARSSGVPLDPDERRRRPDGGLCRRRQGDDERCQPG